MGLFYFFGAIAIIFGAISLAIKIGTSDKAAAKRAKKAAEQHRKENLKLIQALESNTWIFPVEEFRKRCAECGIFYLQSDTENRKAKSIAENILFLHGVPKEYYAKYTGKDVLKSYISELSKQRDEELQQQMQQLHDEDIALEKIYTRYANYRSKQKSISICKDAIADYERIIHECDLDRQSVMQGGEATYLSGKQHLSSWAIHGGIASGIAGGAAGIAVAIDVAKRNKVKQEQNANLAKAVATIAAAKLTEITKRKMDAEQQIEHWNKELKQASALLSANKDAEELLTLLHPMVIHTEPTQAGGLMLKVQLDSTPGLKIQNADAVVDGSIVVLIKHENKVVGKAICALPYGGATTYRKIDCICTNLATPAQEYTFAFQPHHLWLVETKTPVFYVK